MKETQRANLAREVETQRANIARESETHRSNVTNEDIARANLAQRAFEYSDMAGYVKAEKVASTIEKSTKSIKNVADAGKAIMQSAFSPFNIKEGGN
jgi:hypothetical protein